MKLLNVIGQGTFGTVHRALWKGMFVAAKVVPVSVSDQDKVLHEVGLCQ